MSKYVLLRIEDDAEADHFVRDLALFPRDPILTSCGYGVFVEVVPGLDAGDAEIQRFGSEDIHGLSLETAIGWSYERGPQLAAEWETSA